MLAGGVCVEGCCYRMVIIYLLNVWRCPDDGEERDDGFDAFESFLMSLVSLNNPEERPRVFLIPIFW